MNLSEEIFGTVETIGNVQTYGYVGDPLPDQPVAHYINTIPNWTISYPYGPSAREQVQDEILTKVAEAIESDDLKKAKELLALAKTLKEL